MLYISTVKLCLLAFICVNSLKFGSSKEVEPRAEMLNYCAYLHALTGNYEVIGAVISWGKWTSGPGTSDEIPSPQYQTINQGDSLRICSSGRAWTPSGTTAYIVLTETKTYDPIVIGWDVPFIIGNFQHYINYNSTHHTIFRYELGSSQPTSHLYEYYLYKN